MKHFLPLILLATGCQTQPARPLRLPPAEMPFSSDQRFAAQIGRYTLGAYADPADPRIRHDSHVIQRLEREARWDLRPASVPQIEPSVAPSVPTTEEPLADGSTLTVVDAAPVRSSVTVVPPSLVPGLKPPPPELPPALVPNPDGWLDLTVVAAPADTEVNPFAVRDAGPAAFREISLQVAGLIGGSFPGALVNGRLVEPGDRVDSLTVVQIETDSVLFRLAERLIRIPVSSKAARLRLAL